MATVMATRESLSYLRYDFPKTLSSIREGGVSRNSYLRYDGAYEATSAAIWSAR
jgi:hypothetical protein